MSEIVEIVLHISHMIEYIAIFRKNFRLKWKAFEVYFMGVGTARSLDVAKHGCHLGRHLEFYPELEIS